MGFCGYYTDMETLASTQTMEVIDSKAQSDYAIPGLILMEQAGVKAWRALIERLADRDWKEQRFLCIAGGGNNGGDALVMAREALFAGVRKTTVLLVGSRISNACATQRNICRSLGLSMVEAESSGDTLASEALKVVGEADILIDGLAGTGLRGMLTGLSAELVKAVNVRKSQGAFVFSVDIPSGCSDLVSAAAVRVQADVTITMGLQKAACYHPPFRPSWGEVIRINPSFPIKLLKNAPAVALLCDDGDLRLPAVSDQSYKNRRGHVGLFAGSQTYTGAPRLSARAAFHARGGLVTLYCDKEITSVVATESPSVIIRGLDSNSVVSAGQLMDLHQALVAGPGWGEGREDLLLTLLRSGLPMVLDADGITCFANLVGGHRLQANDHGPLVLTPHPGELHRMLEILNMPLLAQESGTGSSPEAFIDALQRVAVALEVILVYKSHVVWIVDGRSAGNLPLVVDGMNSSLGVAGSGDVLTGIVGAFLAQGLDALEAAKAGVIVHQKAGRIARDAHSWFDSQELVDAVGNACRTFERGAP